MTLRHQIIALAIIPLVIAILAITTFITWQSANLAKNSIDTFEQNMLKAKEAEILNLTHLALSAIQTTYGEAGPDDEAAKEKVAAILTSLDYGKDGYFFVYDYDGNNIVHPRQSFRHGRNWLEPDRSGWRQGDRRTDRHGKSGRRPASVQMAEAVDRADRRQAVVRRQPRQMALGRRNRRLSR